MKKIIIILAFTLLGIWTVSADLSDWLFCLLKKDAVTISLKQTAWYYKCKDTIVSLEHLIIETAKDLMKVQTYLNRWRDIDYRKTVKIEKKTLLDKLLLSRSTVLTNIKTFEANLLQKSIQYFIIKATPYKISIQKSLVKIRSFSGVITQELNAYQFLLRAQIAVIDKLSKVTTQGQLTDLLKTYVYLKKEIEWKSE